MTLTQQEQLLATSLKDVTHRELALADPLYFMGYYMGQRCLPHREQFLDFYLESPTHKLHLAPREHWKTTTMSGFLMWRILNNPNLRILVVSNTLQLSRDIVTSMRDQFALNPKIVRDFGILKTDSWGKEAFRVPRTDLNIKEPTVMAGGLGTAILGYHYDIVWCDDIVKTENQWTEEQREKVLTWFEGTLLRCCDRELIITGTRKHIDDLYHQLMTRGGYYIRVDKAILDEEKQEVLAPEVHSYDFLVAERHRMGLLRFSQEMQNEPVAMKGLELKKEWIQYYDLNRPPAFQWYYMGVDPAMGRSTGASYTAVILIGVTTRYDFYVLDIQRHRWTVEWKDRIKELYDSYISRGWPPLTVGIESIMTFRMLPEELMETTAMPIRMVQYREKGDTQIKDEWHRILALGDFFRHGRVYLPHPDQYPMTGVFEHDEYLTFPKGEYTDMLNALNIAINLVQAVPSGEAAFRIG